MDDPQQSERDFLYGTNPAFETLRAGRRKVVALHLNEAIAGQPRMRTLQHLCREREVPVRLCNKSELFRLADTTEHQGIVLETGAYPYVACEELLNEPRLLLIDNVEDPHNVGAILRSAEAFGFSAVMLPTRGSPGIYPSVVKASAGASEFLKIARDCNAVTYAKRTVRADYRILALDAGGTTPIGEIKGRLPPKFVLVIGGEDRSVGQFILNAADAVIALPRCGRINSLNASVAAGIALYELSS